MAADPARAIALLDGRFMLDHPVDAAIEILLDRSEHQ